MLIIAKTLLILMAIMCAAVVIVSMYYLTYLVMDMMEIELGDDPFRNIFLSCILFWGGLIFISYLIASIC